MRTPEEVVARIHKVTDAGDDWFRTIRADLIHVLPLSMALEWLDPNVVGDTWAPWTEEQVRDQAVEYLEFAWNKASNHRGLSSSRSVQHYDAWIWLLFDDDAYAKWSDTPYVQYGAPQLAAAATLLDQPLPTYPDLVRMMDGLPCAPSCQDGCV